MGKIGTEILEIDVNKVIDELRKAYSEEWQAYYQYWLGAKLAKGPMKESVIAELEQHANDELRHAQMLTQRIISLGGTPPLSPEQWAKVATCKYASPTDPHVKTLLEQNIEGERCAIKGYNNLIKMVKDKDVVTYNMAIQILADEVEHEEDLENLLEDLKIGKH